MSMQGLKRLSPVCKRPSLVLVRQGLAVALGSSTKYSFKPRLLLNLNLTVHDQVLFQPRLEPVEQECRQQRKLRNVFRDELHEIQFQECRQQRKLRNVFRDELHEIQFQDC
jgi:hypothetical protein